MGGKAKPTKHTAKQIAGKHHAAKMKAGGAGGGQAGKAKRIAPKQGKKDVYIQCQKCLVMQPSIKTMQIHYQNKHPKQDWLEALKIYDKGQEQQQQQYQEPDYQKYQVEYQQGEGQSKQEQQGQKKQ